MSIKQCLNEKFTVISLFMAFAFGITGVAQASLDAIEKSEQLPSALWQVVRMNESVAATQYRSVDWDGVDAIEAVAKDSMALLVHPLAIDLQSTPILCWRWRIDAPLKNADLATKEGDDFAARVTISFRLPSAAMDYLTRTKLGVERQIYGDRIPDAALNYVWDNRYPIGTKRRNARTDRVQMIVAETGAAHAKSWVVERHDVLADVTEAFGSDQARADMMAVVTDTDDTHESARAGFAELHFVARDAQCHFEPRH